MNSEEFKSYHRNGEIAYVYNNIIVGGNIVGAECKRWYNNAQIKERQKWRYNNMSSEYKSWYKNGQIEKHFYSVDEYIIGEYKKWYNNGEIHKHMYYYNGGQVSHRVWVALIKFQRAYRTRRALKKYFASRGFVEWWYSPTVRGGILAKQELLDMVSKI